MAKSLFSHSVRSLENNENECHIVKGKREIKLETEKRAVLGNIGNKNVQNSKINANLNKLRIDTSRTTTKIPVFRKVPIKINSLKQTNTISNSTAISQDTAQNVAHHNKQLFKKLAHLQNKKVTVSSISIVKHELKEISVLHNVITKTEPVVSESDKPIVCFKKENPENVTSDVVDIDQNDNNNPFLLSIYVTDIYNYLRELESRNIIKEDYLNGRDIKPRMRATLIDWLIDVQVEFTLLQETLHLAVWIIDYYLQQSPMVGRQHLQLIGITALYLASKYEETNFPDVTECAKITDNAVSCGEIFETERVILKVIDFNLGRPISLHFLRRFSKASSAHPQHHNLAKYILDLSLLEYSLCHIKPSLIAAAALYLSFLVYNDMERTNVEFWDKTVVHYTTYKYDDLQLITKKMASLLVNAAKGKFQAVIRKYSIARFSYVSTKTSIITDKLKEFAM